MVEGNQFFFQGMRKRGMANIVQQDSDLCSQGFFGEMSTPLDRNTVNRQAHEVKRP